MSNIFLLIKNYYKMFFCKLFKSKNKLPAFLLLILLGSSFFIMFVSLSYNTINTAISLDIPELALSSFSITILMFVFMLIISESSPIRKNNDEELLLSLPFKKREVVTSKIVYYLSFDLLIILFLILPSYVIYCILVKGSSWFILVRALYVIICSTLFATGISGIISTYLIKMSKRFRYSNIINSIFSVVLVMTFMIIYLAFTFISQDISKANKIYEFYPVVLLTSSIYDGQTSSLLILSLICFSIFIVSIIIRAYYLGKSGNTYHSKNCNLLYKEKKVGRSLYRRELNKYFSIPIYVTNTIFGPLFMIVIALVITIIGKQYFINLIETVIASGYESGIAPESIMRIIHEYFNFGVIALISVILSVSPTTSSAISLEGKELWILKAHPIGYKDVFISKLLVNITIEGLPILLVGILLATRLGFTYLPFIILIPFLVVILTSITGLYINLLYPKLNWESEQEVVKQGISVLVTMSVNFIIVVIPMVLYFILSLNEIFKLSIVAMSYIVFIILCAILLFKQGKKLYEKL